MKRYSRVVLHLDLNQPLEFTGLGVSGKVGIENVASLIRIHLTSNARDTTQPLAANHGAPTDNHTSMILQSNSINSSKGKIGIQFGG